MIFGRRGGWWAEDAPQLYITAAYHVPNPVPGALVGQLFWVTNLDGDIALGEYSEGRASSSTSSPTTSTTPTPSIFPRARRMRG